MFTPEMLRQAINDVQLRIHFLDVELVVGEELPNMVVSSFNMLCFSMVY